MNTRHTPHRRGLTLLELIVSLGVSSILLLGMGASLKLSLEATDLGNGPYRNINLAGRTLDQFEREVSYAKGITLGTGSGTEIVIVSPDMDGDGTDETIRYQWAGQAGDPLTRQLNNGITQDLLPSVHAFDLELTLQTIIQTGDATESDEQTWIEQTNAFIVTSNTLDWNDAAGTDFVPALPADAITWSVTRVDLQCAQHGNSNGVLHARISKANASRQPGELVDQVTVLESTLPGSLGWHSIDFPAASGLAPGERVCFTLYGESGNQKVVEVKTLGWSFSSPETWLHYTNNHQNSNWSTLPFNDLVIRVVGTYTTTLSVERDFCKLIFARVQVDQDALMTSVTMRNLPEVAP